MLVTLFASALAQAAPPPRAADWTGRYVYEEDAGTTTGGSPIVVTWTLDIAPGRCALSAQGYQTDEAFRCATTARADTLAVRWIANADGTLANRYGVRMYRPNQPLFTLARGRPALTTRWQGLRTNLKGQAPGRTFRKI